jgi:hypothetical protein
MNFRQIIPCAVAFALCIGIAAAQKYDPSSGQQIVQVAGGGFPGTVTQNALDIASVTTGGTAVTAIAAGHRAKGGWIANPSTATIALCINELAVASGTTSAGSLYCLPPGYSYNLAPTAAAVSVISSDSTHAFAGYGFQ